MKTRRDFFKTSTAGLVGLTGLSAFEPLSAKPAATSTSPRFIFIRKGNGTFPSELVPLTLSESDKKKDTEKQALDLDLNRHELPEWMQPLNDHKDNLTILQGLSAKMCTMGHSTYQSPLAVCRSAERIATIKRASVDIELARMFPSPFEHIELTCARNQKGVVRGMSSIGPKQPNYAFASPGAAYKNLFLAAVDKSADQQADDNLYAFLSRNIQAQDNQTRDLWESQKVGTYAHSVDSLIARNTQLQSMADQIRRAIPKIEPHVLQDQCTTVEKQLAFADLLTASLQAGLSNVITYSIDDLGTNYTGLYPATVELHEIGHGKDTKGVPALEVRRKLRTHHMKVVDRLVQKLKATPEGKGSMFDNTIVMYFPENGETHHSKGTEVPFIILAGNQIKLDISGRYIRLPNYNDEGHKTLGNWYTTLLNAYGNPIDHYGDLDVGLAMAQEGPIRQFMG